MSVQIIVPYFNLLGETFPTTVNGPGNRYMIHLQGCSLGCSGCFNPESWSSKMKNQVDVEILADKILSHNLDGTTISGGEPFQQPGSLLHFIQYLHRDGNPFPKGILIYSGYTEEELEKIPEYHQVIELIDVIVSGRYREDLRVYDSLLSSSNQKFIWGKQKNIKEEELMNQSYEIIIEDNGLKLTGFPDLSKEMRHELEQSGVKIKVN
jgi:anaerobic ribonucleoside-triphosphate reductase activating protein